MGNFGKGVSAVRKLLEQAGYPVTMHIFPGARHMLLQEEAGGQAARARECIAKWIRTQL